MTPLERRSRIYEITETEGEYCKMKAKQDRAEAWFVKLTDGLPEQLRNQLRSYPGMGYFMHHRMLTIICQNMKFADED